MRVMGKTGHIALVTGRRTQRSGSTTWLGAVRRLPAWVRWTVPLALALSVVAAAQWAFIRSSGSDVPSGQPITSAAGSPGGADSGGPQGTVVSLTFNFGTVSQYDFARPLLRRYGMRGTFYVTPDRLDAGEACCITWAQAMSLYREGDEIGTFSADGVDLTVPTSPDPVQDYNHKKQQVCAARERLAQLGLDPQSFAYPAGAYAYEFPTLQRSLTDLVASCGFLSGRMVGGLSVDPGASPVTSIPLPPSEPFAVRTPSEISTSPIALTDLQQAVVAASSADGQWIPLVFAEVCHSTDPTYTSCMATRRPIDDTVFAAFLDWLHRAGEPDGAPAGTTVQTMREVMGAPPQPPLPEPQTYVSLTFDDGDLTQQLAGRLLRDHGMHGTFYLNTGRIDAEDPYYLTWSQVLRLHRDGNDMGGHTADHINLTDPGIPEPVKRDQVCQDRRRLQQMGLDPQSFAYPYGALDAAAKQLVESCGYRSGRSAGGVSVDGPVYAETVPPGDPFATIALDGPSGPTVEGASTEVPSTPLTLDYLKSAVVSAADHGGGWVQVVLHHICSPSDDRFTTCMSGEAAIEERAFAAFLDWLQDAAPDGTSVRTVQQVMSGAR
jgi:peptidoglycan/xylan/chitin deacetylase (PgdA/CDA1 family)